ncbi:MAG: GAF domain-containing protein, partial [Calditrichaeota bacterium]
MIEKLIEIGKQLLVEKDIHRILRLAIDAAIEITHAERGLVILFGEGGEILFEVARNLKKEDIENPKFEISRTIIQKVKAEGQPFCINNALEDRKLEKSKSSLRLNLLSVICLPLKRAGTVFGVVYLDNRAVAGVFKPEACQFATAFADFISLAAYNSLEEKISPHKMSQVEQELRRQHHFEA